LIKFLISGWGQNTFLIQSSQTAAPTKKVPKPRGRPKKTSVLAQKNQDDQSKSGGENTEQERDDDADAGEHEEQLQREEREECERDARNDEIDRLEIERQIENELTLKRKRGGKDEEEAAPPPTPTPPKKKKKRGRAPGALSYSAGDFTALMDAVEEILPTALTDWKFVEAHYNKYAVRFHRKERGAVGLRSKFRDFAWGEPSGGGERNEWETRAKEIEGEIDKKGGVVVIGDDDGDSPSKGSSASENTKPSSASRAKRSSRLGFETLISSHLKEEAKLNEERHRQKMTLFEKLLEKL
jgi:hypothetical protein